MRDRRIGWLWPQDRSPGARSVLMRYLDMYLPRPDLHCGQPWAMAALQMACADAAERVPGQYLQAWEQWRSARMDASNEELVSRLGRMRQLADAVRPG